MPLLKKLKIHQFISSSGRNGFVAVFVVQGKYPVKRIVYFISIITMRGKEGNERNIGIAAAVKIPSHALVFTI